MHVWVDAVWGANESRGVGVGGHAGVGWLVVLQQASEVVGQHEA